MRLKCDIAHFGSNQCGRDLIVGDVHGHFTRLERALARAGFDDAVDRVFCVGDLVDRGPESGLSLEWLVRPWFHSILGNHEDAAIRWARGELDKQTYGFFGGYWNIEAPQAKREERATAFAKLPLAIELETPAGLVGIVHADCLAASWSEFRSRILSESDKDNRPTIDAALYSRNRLARVNTGPVSGVRAVVVGHCGVESPKWIDNLLFIDTEGWSDGFFSVIDAATLQPARDQKVLSHNLNV